LHLLTKRECEVLQLLSEGQSNRTVSETLEISEKTVKNHVSNILQKMNVNDRTQAVVTAIRNGWVEERQRQGLIMTKLAIVTDSTAYIPEARSEVLSTEVI